MGHQLIKAGRSPISTASLTAGSIRNFVNNFGFSQEEHAELSVVQQQALQQGGMTMPGVDFRFIAGPGTPGFDPIASLVPFGASTSSQFTVPAGIVAPDWRELIRVGIDSAIGRLQGGGNDPIGGGLMVPDPTQSQVPAVIGPGAFPGGSCVGQYRNRFPLMVGPNGFPTCPRGFHPLKNGQPFCVRNRRMNPLNPRALSRAGRRVGGFARAVKRARTLKRVCASL